MFNLPRDIQSLIFEFDPTYHLKYQEFVKKLKLTLTIPSKTLQIYIQNNSIYVISKYISLNRLIHLN